MSEEHFGITRYDELSRIERIYVQQRVLELEQAGSSGDFDPGHLSSIHAYLFKDVFPWAGELPVVGLSKSGSAPSAAPQFIAPALDDLCSKLKAEQCLRGLDAGRFAERAAFYLGEINAVHPFREGNGRTQREFTRQLAAGAGHTISWEGFTQEGMVAASVMSHMRGDHSQLASMVRAAIVRDAEVPDSE